MDKLVADLMGRKQALLSYIARRQRGWSRIEDVFQEVMLRVLEQSRKREIAEPLAYAYRVADSVMIAQAGRGGTRSESLDEDHRCDLPLPDEVLQQKERVQAFRAALQGLTPLQRQIFLMRYVEGDSRAQIADRLDLSLEAVKKHLVRAMAEMTRATQAVGAVAAYPTDKTGRAAHER